MFKLNAIPSAVTVQSVKQHDEEGKKPDSPKETPLSSGLKSAITRPENSRLRGRSPSLSLSRLLLESNYHGVPIKDSFVQMVHAGKTQTDIASALHLRRNEHETLTNYMIEKEFICKSHMDAIADASQHRKFMVSFRSAGEETLKRLETGAAAKGHDILEKTIKESSLKKAYGEQADEVYNKLKEANLTGYVGHWDENGLAGIYINDPHAKNGVNILLLDINNLSEVLERLHQWAPDWQTKVYTGDYDMHDMVTFTSGGGQPYTPLAGLAEEKHIINSINRAVAAVDPNRPFDYISHNVIRHGPQVNFVAHMKTYEAEVAREGLVGAVARPGAFPLAVINRGEWMLASNMEELMDIYSSSRAQIKETWKPNGSLVLLANESDSSDRVFLRRSAVSLRR